MRESASFLSILVLSTLTALAGCKSTNKSSKAPQEQEEIGEPQAQTPKGVDETNEEAFVSQATPAAEEEVIEEEEEAKPQVERPKTKEVCTGKGKRKTCQIVDSDPQLSATLGVQILMDGYQWGMSPDEVLTELSKGIEKEYREKQAKTKDPLQQDRNRVWRRDQLKELKQGHIKFTTSSRHTWGVSLVQFEFADDANEEMVWLRDGEDLRKFYFFKDGRLWKIFYAFNTSKWPGKSYDEVIEDPFKQWFGINPEVKIVEDEKTATILLRYHQWSAKGGEKIRAFDMTSVHGVIVLAVVDGNAEQQIGERLPNIKKEREFSDAVGNVLGGSDVRYDENGNIITETPNE